MWRAPSTNAGRRVTVGERARMWHSSVVWSMEQGRSRRARPRQAIRRRHRHDAYSHVKLYGEVGGRVDGGEGVGGSGERVKSERVEVSLSVWVVSLHD